MPIGYKNKICKNNKGSMLAYALIIMFVVSIILVSMLSYITAQLRFSFNRVEKQQAFQMAEAGIYYYKWYLAHYTSGKTPAEITTFWQTGGDLGLKPDPVDYAGIGQYRLVITPPSQGSTAVTVTSTGWTYKDTNLMRTIRVRFRRPAWSEYSLLTNAPMHLGKDVEVYGKLHSNGGIWFDGIAHDTVSALPSTYIDPTYTSNKPQFGVHTSGDQNAPNYPWPAGTVQDRPDIFMGGREFPVSEVSFSGVTLDLAAMEAIGNTDSSDPNNPIPIVNNCWSGGCYFDNSGSRYIVLKGDKFDICTVDTYHNVSYTVSKFKKNSGSGTCTSCSGDCATSFDIPQDGVIFVKNNAWIKGSINNKRVIIVAANPGGSNPSNAYIGVDASGNISYSDLDYDCNTKLGIVAEKDIMVTKDAPNDFVIDAALLAQTGTIGISQNFTSKNSITFNGAVASFLEPFFAHGTNGFAVRFFKYDSSLMYCPPPNFPTGNLYSIDLWEEL